MNDPIRYAKLLLAAAADPILSLVVPEVVQVGRYQLESLARCVLDQAETIRSLRTERKEPLAQRMAALGMAAPSASERRENLADILDQKCTTETCGGRLPEKLLRDEIVQYARLILRDVVNCDRNHLEVLSRCVIGQHEDLKSLCDERAAMAASSLDMAEQIDELRAAVICAANLAGVMERCRDKLRILREAANRTDVPFVMPDGVE